MKFTALDRYPAVSRDIAIVVERETPAQKILDVIRRAGKKLVRNMEVFDIYEGEHIGEGKKSVALSITYQAPDHTLKDDEITSAHEAILNELKKQLNAELRG